MVAHLHTVTFLRNQLKSLDMNKVVKSLLWAKQKCYEYSNKLQRLLVNRLKPRQFQSSPNFLMQPNSSPTYCPHAISKVFGEFYCDLYNYLNSDSKYQFSQTKFDSFFASLHLPKLTSSHLSLNARATAEELAEVIKNLPTHKSPGPDCLTFLPILSPYLLDLFFSFI